MRVLKLGSICAVLVLGSCVAGSVLAQDNAGAPGAGAPGGGRQGRGGFGQGRFGAPQISLANIPVDLLTKELKLTDDQKTSVEKVRTKMRADMQAMAPAPGTQVDFRELQQKSRAINEQANKDIEAVLNDDQKKQAPELVKTLQTVQTLRIPVQTYSDLKLTDDQKKKLAALAADVEKDRAAKMQEMQAARQAGDQDKMREIMTSMRGNGQPDEKTLAVLTADQKEIVQKYIKEHPQPAGGRRFGPGAGAGATQ